MTDSHEEYVRSIVKYVYENGGSKVLGIVGEDVLLAIIHREKSL